MRSAAPRRCWSRAWARSRWPTWPRPSAAASRCAGPPETNGSTPMPPDDAATIFDAAIIGGSYAGLSAAMTLARARRRILVIDAGVRRNRFAAHAHGLVTQDGRAPDAIAGDAREQVLAYPDVTWRQAGAVAAGGVIDRITIEDDAGGRWQARRLVLANGVEDTLPDGKDPTESGGRE